MSARPRVDAMRPSRPGRTRTADPRMPDQYWTRGRYVPYIAFGSCGILLFAVGFGLLRALWVLGDHDPAAWEALIRSYAHPLYVAFHLLALGALTWFGLRFFGLFPRTQPPRIGPFPRPPQLFFRLALNGAFLLVSLAVGLVIAGVLP